MCCWYSYCESISSHVGRGVAQADINDVVPCHVMLPLSLTTVTSTTFDSDSTRTIHTTVQLRTQHRTTVSNSLVDQPVCKVDILPREISPLWAGRAIHLQLVVAVVATGLVLSN
jgi:hypothetical protein